MCYVYFHKNPITKELFYVGIGRDYRSKDFKSGRNKHYKNYIRKHGKPIIEIIHNYLSLEQACFYEQYYIALYGRIGYENYGILVNKSEGGEVGSKGIKHSEKSIKIRVDKVRGQKRSDEFKSNLSKLHKGKKVSQEVRNKISKTILNLGPERGNKIKETLSSPLVMGPRSKAISEGRKKKIKQLDKEGTLIKIFNSLEEAKVLTGIKGISNVACGYNKTAGGYKWEYY
jgi:hypothetical protein